MKRIFFLLLTGLFSTLFCEETPLFLEQKEDSSYASYLISDVYLSSQKRLENIEERLNQIESAPSKKGPLKIDEHAPSGRSLQATLDATFLYWYSTITDLSYAEVKDTLLRGNQATTFSSLAPVSIETKEFDWQWNPGLRVGLGVFHSQDQWKLNVDWTYFYNKGSDSTQLPSLNRVTFQADPEQGQLFLSFPWLNIGLNAGNVDNELSGPILNRIDGKWRLLFNQIDLALSKTFFSSSRINFSPHLGLRGHWSHLKLKSTGRGDYTASTGEEVSHLTASTQIKQRLWGVGLLTGLISSWNFTKHWGLVGKGAISLIYGRFKLRSSNRVFATSANGQIAQNYRWRYRRQPLYTLVQAIDLSIGSRFRDSFFNDSLKVYFDLMWEFHYWVGFNQLARPTLITQSKEYWKSANGNLSLSGISAHIGLMF